MRHRYANVLEKTAPTYTAYSRRDPGTLVVPTSIATVSIAPCVCYRPPTIYRFRCLFV